MTVQQQQALDAMYPHTKYRPVSPPISLGQAKEQEVALTKEMQTCLDEDFPLETEEGMTKRQEILDNLQTIIEEWTYSVGVTHAGLDDETARLATGRIFVFGSTKLGVVTPGSDVDSVCVAPKHVSRDYFFDGLVPILENTEGVTNVKAVPEAYTPIITFLYHGVDVDMGFCRLNVASLKNLTSLEEDQLLVNVDEKSSRSLNGCRVNELVVKLVPNVETFRRALRMIRKWAKSRGLQGNMFGTYPGFFATSYLDFESVWALWAPCRS